MLGLTRSDKGTVHTRNRMSKVRSGDRLIGKNEKADEWGELTTYPHPVQGLLATRLG